MNKQLDIVNSRPTLQSSSPQDLPGNPRAPVTSATERQRSTKEKRKRKKKKRPSSIPSPVRKESGQGDAEYTEAGKESAEANGVAHNPESMGPLGKDSVTSGILGDICRLLEGVLNDQQRAKEFLESIRGGEDVQLWLDTLQVLAKRPEIPTWLRSSIFHALLRLSKISDLFPQCLMITNVEKLGDHPIGYGGFGDLWKGKIGGQILALKVPRISQTSEVQKLLKDFMREGILWQQLEHPNVLPFMGIYYMNEKRTQLCLVSPWMEQGSLTKYLETTPREGVDHYLLVDDVASGLTYLHYKKVVHGDLKGANVLVAADGRARIADFGLSRVVDSRAIRLSSSKTNSSTGTTRWCAPELFNPPSTTTTFSDVYAFAGVCCEIFSGKVPFHALNDPAVIVAVMVNKEHPPRPEGTLLNDGMWKIMEDCWNFDPRLRPTASDIVTRVAGLKSFKTEYRPARDWDISNLCQIWKDVKQPVLDKEALIRLQRTLGSSAEKSVAIHNHTTSDRAVTVEEDSVDSDIVEDLCRFLEGVLNDERRVKELLKSIQESKRVDVQLWINILLLVRIDSTCSLRLIYTLSL
ncbi:kinase-like protein [Marasmius fiardii PR-910]|nr:kinase-like protein [Marasmius fiardii PR-910]